MSSKNLKLQKKIYMKSSQRMVHGSDTEEARRMHKSSNYDSPHSGNGKLFISYSEQHNPRHIKSNYHKYAERNYKSGGSGSTSGGGHSMEGMMYIKKANFYPNKVKHNVSDMTDQENIHSINEDKESMFYPTKVWER